MIRFGKFTKKYDFADVVSACMDDPSVATLESVVHTNVAIDKAAESVMAQLLAQSWGLI